MQLDSGRGMVVRHEASLQDAELQVGLDTPDCVQGWYESPRRGWRGAEASARSPYRGGRAQRMSMQSP